ncbi:hypothetical protein BC827DRAFT_830187 [Russula dissimulans]|nr:hypothetical protein BC827DRAFT_830187 [Russula dissimulans]
MIRPISSVPDPRLLISFLSPFFVIFFVHPKVHRAPSGTYEGALAVLSQDLVLFLKRDAPSIELCRVLNARAGSSNRGRSNSSGSSSNGHAPAPAPSLHVVRTLALPMFHPDCRVHTAYMQTDRPRYRPREPLCPNLMNVNRQQPKQKQQQQQQQQQQHRRRRSSSSTRAPAPLAFHSAPEDMVVGITFLLRHRDPRMMHWKKVVMTISHRALFALAAGADLSTIGSEDHSGGGGGNGNREGGGGEEGERKSEDDEGGEGTVTREREVGMGTVPWEKWGPRAARVISPPMFQWITAHAGQRWLSLETDKLVVRDFSAARIQVQRARAHARARARARARSRAAPRPDPDSTNDDDDNADNDVDPCGAGAVPSPAKTVIPRGLACFKEDVVSELPFVETRLDTRVRAGDMVLTDGERLVAFVRAVSNVFHLFLLLNPFDLIFTGPASDLRNSRTAGSPRLRGRVQVVHLNTRRIVQITPRSISQAWRNGGDAWEREFLSISIGSGTLVGFSNVTYAYAP